MHYNTQSHAIQYSLVFQNISTEPDRLGQTITVPGGTAWICLPEVAGHPC